MITVAHCLCPPQPLFSPLLVPSSVFPPQLLRGSEGQQEPAGTGQNRPWPTWGSPALPSRRPSAPLPPQGPAAAPKPTLACPRCVQKWSWTAWTQKTLPVVRVSPSAKEGRPLGLPLPSHLRAGELGTHRWGWPSCHLGDEVHLEGLLGSYPGLGPFSGELPLSPSFPEQDGVPHHLGLWTVWEAAVSIAPSCCLSHPEKENAGSGEQSRRSSALGAPTKVSPPLKLCGRSRLIINLCVIRQHGPSELSVVSVMRCFISRFGSAVPQQYVVSVLGHPESL